MLCLCVGIYVLFVCICLLVCVGVCISSLILWICLLFVSMYWFVCVGVYMIVVYLHGGGLYICLFAIMGD